ncbi:hypothetical protein NQ315_001267 [Exocentrus adspersus]|uniref:Uncharacterized protein n=1 Tax=Exocentrus adspersus TaxID=1586481 RepID=A0AAV8WG24_9CUCU|nr:hypothetical protein NQ315_001267 [Exocentrus adspersus]
MGNRLCKKKVDVVDSPESKPPTPFDRIINRLHLKPNSWKSDPQLNQKHNNKCDAKQRPEDKSNIVHAQPLSKSSDWTEVDLEVPDKDEHVHLRNPQLALIFSKENGTPTPPPRKAKRNFRETIEAVAKNSLQAFQSRKPVEAEPKQKNLVEEPEQAKPVEEPLFVKKTVNYKCPLCDEDAANHNRDHHHHHNHNKSSKEEKRRKNLSVVSLPNYNELKLTVAHFEDIDKTNSTKTTLPENKKAVTGSMGKLDNYITRCRSFGSLLPQQLKKLRSRKAPPDVESDDSFGALEDWDLGLIEHYNPKDASLPRPRKANSNLVADVESLIVPQEEVAKPKPPVRRSESLVKKLNREAVESAARSETKKAPPQERLFMSNLPTEEDGKVEHSSLMKILEQFSIRDKEGSSNQSSLTPSLLEFERNLAVGTVEDFIAAEKVNTDKELGYAGKKNPGVVS